MQETLAQELISASIAVSGFGAACLGFLSHISVRAVAAGSKIQVVPGPVQVLKRILTVLQAVGAVLFEVACEIPSEVRERWPKHLADKKASW